jgi:hypothetical protein
MEKGLDALRRNALALAVYKMRKLGPLKSDLPTKPGHMHLIQALAIGSSAGHAACRDCERWERNSGFGKLGRRNITYENI